MSIPQDRILHVDMEVEDGKVNITAEWQGEIVRCKDCKHRNEPSCQIINSMYGIDDDDYCSYGERKEE